MVEEPTAADEARYALWGEIDAGTRRVAHRIGAEGPEGPVASRVAAYRRTRQTLLRMEVAQTPESLRSWLRDEVGRRRPADAAVEVSWTEAFPLPLAGATRGEGGDRLLSCAVGGRELRAQVHVDAASRACAVTGRVLGAGRAPAAGVALTFFVDRRAVARAVTDAFGEFAFDARDGTVFGVRVGDGADAVHVALVDLGSEGGRESSD